MNLLYYLRKLSVAIFSAIIFISWLSYFSYTPVSQQKGGSWYVTLPELIFIFSIYIVPVFLVGGVLFSVIVDSRFKNAKRNRKLLNFLAYILIYILGGILVTFIFLLVITGGRILTTLNDGTLFYVYGSCGSLLFYMLDELFKLIGKYLKNTFVK